MQVEKKYVDQLTTMNTLKSQWHDIHELLKVLELYTRIHQDDDKMNPEILVWSLRNQTDPSDTKKYQEALKKEKDDLLPDYVLIHNRSTSGEITVSLVNQRASRNYLFNLGLVSDSKEPFAEQLLGLLKNIMEKTADTFTDRLNKTIQKKVQSADPFGEITLPGDLSAQDNQIMASASEISAFGNLKTNIENYRVVQSTGYTILFGLNEKTISLLAPDIYLSETDADQISDTKNYLSKLIAYSLDIGSGFIFDDELFDLATTLLAEDAHSYLHRQERLFKAKFIKEASIFRSSSDEPAS